MSKLRFRVRLRLLTTSRGGRTGPVFSDYRPSWNLGNTWSGKPTLNDGRVILEGGSDLQPGGEALGWIEPLAPEFWRNVDAGRVIPMQEGPHVVGEATVLERIEG